MLRTGKHQAWGFAVAALRRTLAVALIGCTGLASAAVVTFNNKAMDDIFGQTSFGTFKIDIRFNEALSIVAPSLLTIDTNAEFNGGGTSLGALVGQLQIPSDTVSMFFVDAITFCGREDASIVGCGNNPGALIAVESSFAAGAKGAALMAHELGHNLGLSHLMPSVTGNLMNSNVSGGTTLTTDQIDFFLDLSTGASRRSILRSDANGLYISITPIAVLAAAVPEPHTWAMLSVGLLGVAGWARRRRASAV